MDQHLLSIILLTPLAGLLVLFLLPGNNKNLIRIWANLTAIAGFLLSLPLLQRFQNGAPGFQFEEKVSWRGGIPGVAGGRLNPAGSVPDAVSLYIAQRISELRSALDDGSMQRSIEQFYGEFLNR